MQILVVSDTHGRSDRLCEVIRRTRADVLLFLGDGLRDLSAIPDDTLTIRAVRGNCDLYGADTPELRIETFGQYRIFLAHGHRYGVKYGLDALIATAAAAGADAVLYGHTHEPYCRVIPAGEEYGGIILERPLALLCPGSLGEPRRGAPTFGTLTLRENGILPALGEY